MRFVSLVIALACLWTLLSGHTEVIVVGMGVAGIALITWLARRMRVVDEEGVPFDLSPRALPYSLWLLVEIVRSNVAVARIVASRELAIQPQLVRVPTGLRSDLGRVVYANSITMTPGTVTLEADEDSLLVHALTDATAEGLRSGSMEQRAARVAPSRKRVAPAARDGEQG